jgi:hypothetical protein
MKRYLIQTGTVTYAIKGRDLLRRKGFKVNIERKNSDKSYGCGYAISLVGNLQEATQILQQNGVKILEITEEI